MNSLLTPCLWKGAGLSLSILVLLNTAAWSQPTAADTSTKPKSRTFLFTYEAALTKLKPGAKARIWLPMPPNTPHQDIRIHSINFPKAAQVKETKGPKFGNQFYYIEAKAGRDGAIACRITYRVRREEVLGDSKTQIANEGISAHFLKANKTIPVGGKPSLVLLKDKNLPNSEFAMARALFDIVNQHMKYNKPAGKPWGRGDAVWACDSKYGNCTDFHSLFISLSRTKKLPAKFEMGFPLPPKRGKGKIGGYHCWAWFKPKAQGWFPVDISEANRHPELTKYYFGNLTENRVVFTTGRDLTLTPRQDGPPLNFLVYPYAEVNGKTYANISRKFSFEDVR